MSTVRVVVLGVVLGLALGTVAWLVADPEPPGGGADRAAATTSSVAGPPPSAEAAEALVAAEGRSRRGTWYVVELYTREVLGRVVLSSRTVRAQRPPDWIVSSEQGVERLLGGRRTGCARDDTGAWSCRTEPAGTTGDVEEDLRNLRALVLGSHPLYLVGQEDHCFTLTLRAPTVTAPPYGERDVRCYHPSSGAVVRRVTERRSAEPGVVAVDTTVADEHRSVVHDADFALPEGAEP